jgi:fructokinase
MPRTGVVGGIELGGTKVVCAIGTGPHDLKQSPPFPTGHDPAVVLKTATEWLRSDSDLGEALDAIGIASFGPIDLNPDSPRYGRIGSTSKSGWSGASVLDPIRSAFPRLPIAVDTDVNAAVRAEKHWGHGVGLRDLVYVTVGTGIGAGVITHNHVLLGRDHPEIGHMLLPRVQDDAFQGVCPFHGDCWEGLCSGPALTRRAGRAPENLPPDWDGWQVTAWYIARALVNLTYLLAPARIILGGSVTKAGRLGAEALLQTVRDEMSAALRGYAVPSALDEDADRFVVRPALEDTAGICGALMLAHDAL